MPLEEGAQTYLAQGEEEQAKVVLDWMKFQGVLVGGMTCHHSLPTVLVAARSSQVGAEVVLEIFRSNFWCLEDLVGRLYPNYHRPRKIKGDKYKSQRMSGYN